MSVNLSRFLCLDAHTSFGCRVEGIAWHGAILAIGTKYGKYSKMSYRLHSVIAILLFCEFWIEFSQYMYLIQF